MKILITGGSGFLGKVLKQNLTQDHKVFSLGRSSTNDIPSDLNDQNMALPEVDMVIHAAGKAHLLPKTAEEEADFYRVNEEGTINLIHQLPKVPKSFIFISTVAVYGEEEGVHIDETHALNGNTPYAKSKINAENFLKKWAEKENVSLLILRLPLVVAKNAPGNLGAIIKSIQKGYYFRLGEGAARKSMVLAEDIAIAIPSWVKFSGTYNLTDGNHPKLSELDAWIAKQLGKSIRKMPIGPLKALAKIGDVISFFPLNSYRLNKLNHELTFSDKKAKQEIGWKPRAVVGNFNP